MVRKFVAVTVLVFAASPVVQADGDGSLRYDTILHGSTAWQQTGTDLQSDEEYRRSVSNNRSIVQRELQTVARRLLADGGAVRGAAGLLGAAVSASIADTRVYLNDSRTIGMVLSDTTRSDRTVMLQFRKSW